MSLGECGQKKECTTASVAGPIEKLAAQAEEKTDCVLDDFMQWDGLSGL